MAVMRCDFDYNLNYNGGAGWPDEEGQDQRRSSTSHKTYEAAESHAFFMRRWLLCPSQSSDEARKVPAPGTPTPDFHFPGDANNHHRHSSSSAPMESAGGLLLLLLTHGYTWTYNDTFEVRIMCRWWDWRKPCIFVWEYSSRNLPLHFLFFSVFHS